MLGTVHVFSISTSCNHMLQIYPVKAEDGTPSRIMEFPPNNCPLCKNWDDPYSHALEALRRASSISKKSKTRHKH